MTPSPDNAAFSDPIFNRPSGVVLPLLLRRKVEHYSSTKPTAEKPKRKQSDGSAARNLENKINHAMYNITEIQRQLYRGEEAYFDETYQYGNIYKGWDTFIDHRLTKEQGGGVGAAINTFVPKRRMPVEDRWFSSSTYKIPRVGGAIIPSSSLTYGEVSVVSRVSAESKGNVTIPQQIPKQFQLPPPKLQPKPQPKPQPQPKLQLQPKLQPQPKPQPQPTIQPQPKLQPQPKPQPQQLDYPHIATAELIHPPVAPKPSPNVGQSTSPPAPSVSLIRGNSTIIPATADNVTRPSTTPMIKPKPTHHQQQIPQKNHMTMSIRKKNRGLSDVILSDIAPSLVRSVGGITVPPTLPMSSSFLSSRGVGASGNSGDDPKRKKSKKRKSTGHGSGPSNSSHMPSFPNNG